MAIHAYDMGKLFIKKPIKVADNWVLENDHGYLYFTNKNNKFYSINIPASFSIPENKNVKKTEEVPQWLLPPAEDATDEEKRAYDTASSKWNSDNGTYQKYIMVKKNIYESVKVKDPRNLLVWHTCKPSIDLLYEICKMAAQVYRTMDAEMECFIIWNTETKAYELLVPTQTVSGATCDFEYTDLEVGKHEVVVDVHSHHSMTCSFSGTDDDDDSVTSYIPHISVVIKNIKSFDFSDIGKNLDIRLTYNGSFNDLSLNDVFDIPVYNLKQVKKKTYVSTLPEKPLGYSYNYGFPKVGVGLPKTYEGELIKNGYRKTSTGIWVPDITRDVNNPVIGTPGVVSKEASITSCTINGIDFSPSDMTSEEVRNLLDDLEDEEMEIYHSQFHNDFPAFIVNYFLRNPNLLFEYCEAAAEKLDTSPIQKYLKE